MDAFKTTHLMCHSEAVVDVARAQFSEEHVIHHVPATVVTQGLVHHIPCVDPTVEMAHRRLDVPDAEEERAIKRMARAGETYLLCCLP